MDLSCRRRDDLLRILEGFGQHTCSTKLNKEQLVRRIEALRSPPVVIACESPLMEASFYTAILDILRSIQWPQEAGNRGHRRIGASGFVLGATKGVPRACGFQKHESGWFNTSVLPRRRSRQDAADLLRFWSLLQEIVWRRDPSFTFTSVQVNRNLPGKAHIDPHDVSYQYALSLGSFTGGRLVVATDNPSVFVAHNTHARLTKCDGRHSHWVESYEVTRYSLIMYKIFGTGTPRLTNLECVPKCGLAGQEKFPK